MSISQDSAATIVCREVFDETSHPSNEEVLDYAKRLGIDPDAEPHLLDLAREGLMAALPKGWSPCFHEVSGAWYYYEASTGTTTWEHPLDAVYRELVEQARAGNRQMSVEEDSKTTAKDLESHEEASYPKETIGQKEISTKEVTPTKETSVSKVIITPTKIPTKLAPLKRLDRLDGIRKESSSFDKLLTRRGSDTKPDNPVPLASDRAARDYTNLRFQDPKFYECPKLLETVSTNNIANPDSVINTSNTPKKELDLREVLRRSESLSPRHEKDWEQLSSKFSSEENIIDIDKLSASTLARSEKPEKFDKEKHPNQLGHQKELTLSGGGTMFLKSNRSRDNTPSQDTKLDDFRTLTISDEASNVVGDKLKSILREKQSEDDERPLEEERKSVRFDLEKEVNIKFTYSGSDDDWDSISEEQHPRISAVVTNKITGTILSTPQGSISFDRDEDKNEDSEEKEINTEKLNSSLTKLNLASRNSKIVGRRFVVQNVSENEHLSQISKEKLSSDCSIDYVPSNKFENIKNIDLVSKSETDCSIAKSSDSDELRRSKLSFVVEKGRKTALRFNLDQQFDDSETSDASKTNHDTEIPRQSRQGKTKLNHLRSFDDVKMDMNKDYEKEIEELRKEFAVKFEQTRKELEENFVQQKLVLEENLNEKLEELKREMAEKEEQEIQRLIAEMDEARLENLKKVRIELEACYEKERQEILANLKIELEERKKELLELRNQEIDKLENEHERDLGEEKLAKLNEYELNKQHTEKIEAMKKELEKEFDDLRNELRVQQREKITKITEDHEKCLAEILRDFRIDEDLARKMYKQRLEEIRADFSRDAEKEARRQSERALQQESIDFEKMRCEKRLLQDKYTALKEKYMKLKNDVRLAVERRSKRKEGYTTASETERSTCTRTRSERTESSEQNTPQKKARSGSITSVKAPDGKITNEDSQAESEDTKGSKIATVLQKSIDKGDSKCSSKFESDDTTTASETNANMLKKKKSFNKKSISEKRQAGSTSNNNNNNIENPVENIRKQLEKLEDLGDQLPSNETAYTLRYPFQDKVPPNASSELEFFRHRIHVERDSVRRARQALRQQRNAFQGRQRAWKQRSARATLDQLVQEERELSDMEVSLLRTRSLLDEKVIHLRHLEQSLERVANAKRTETDTGSIKNDEQTLSDMSSASSGFSSTDLGTDTFIDKPDHYQGSTKIIASLESLNSEIRAIWGVLHKPQHVPPVHPYLRFHHLTAQSNNIQGTFGTPNIQSNILSQYPPTQPPITTTQNIIAQYGPNSGYTTSVGTVGRNALNLSERCVNLRDWLREIPTTQATL